MRDARSRPASTRSARSIFAQSHVTAHAEANWLLCSVTSFGELRRMTQFKDKSDDSGVRLGRASSRTRCSMAGDILLYQTDIVPVGDRPAPAPRAHARHRRALQLALRRDVHGAAGRLSRRAAHKVKNLQDPERIMSTSGGNRRGSSASSTRRTTIRKKFKIAVTDSEREIRHAPRQGGHLEPDRDHVGGHRRVDRRRSRHATTEPATAQFKERRRRSRVALFEPIQERYRELRADDPGDCGDCSRTEPSRPARRRSRRSTRCTSAWASSGSARGRLRPAAPQPPQPSALATLRSRARRRRAPSSECAGGGARGVRRPRTCASPGGSDPRGV